MFFFGNLVKVENLDKVDCSEIFCIIVWRLYKAKMQFELQNTRNPSPDCNENPFTKRSGGKDCNGKRVVIFEEKTFGIAPKKNHSIS